MTSRTFKELYKKPSQTKIAINNAIEKFMNTFEYVRTQSIKYQGNCFKFTVQFVVDKNLFNYRLIKITPTHIFIWHMVKGEIFATDIYRWYIDNNGNIAMYN